MLIRLATAADLEGWSALRAQLWPAENAAEHAVFAAQWLREPDAATLLAFDTDTRMVGFVEVALRPYAEGCETSPIGYLEGWYVIPGQRRHGVGRALVRAAEDWVRARGCSEMASDTEIENTGSQEAHERLGYERVETVVIFRRSLERPTPDTPPASRP
jgi:aminoglycoside 6'-N-acetyltransferase I